MRPRYLLVASDAHPMAAAPRARRGGTGAAVTSAVTLHAACLGALIGFQHSQMPPTLQQEMVIELAMVVPPNPPISAAPAPQLSADEPVVPLPPEPIKVAATPPETAPPVPLAQLPVAGDLAPAETPLLAKADPPLPVSLPPALEPWMPETAAVVAPTPLAVEITPPTVAAKAVGSAVAIRARVSASIATPSRNRAPGHDDPPGHRRQWSVGQD